mmetsp:Transcript_2912/g.7595  ORF Transcript_2912/g.7595 Transcript_2912/m.7595 type:complete len:399 (+) Transcript_2912:76-1272(+)
MPERKGTGVQAEHARREGRKTRHSRRARQMAENHRPSAPPSPRQPQLPPLFGSRRVHHSHPLGCECLLLEVLLEQRLGRPHELGVVCRALARIGQVGAHLHAQDLAKLHAPLVEGVDVPDPALHGRPVLVEREQLAEPVRVALRQQQRERRAVPGERLVGDEAVRDALGLQLSRGLAERQGVRLREEVRHELVVVRDGLAGQMHRVLRHGEADELGRDDAALVHELVEGVLAVGARLAEVDGAGRDRHVGAVHRHALAIALHVQLLDVRHEAHQGLAVRQHCAALVAQHAAVPHGEQAHEQGQVLLLRGRHEMLVHGASSLVELHHNVHAVLEREGQRAHGAPAAEAATDPVPEAEHVGVVDAEGLGLVQGCGARRQVLAEAVGAELLDEPLLHRLGV